MKLFIELFLLCKYMKIYQVYDITRQKFNPLSIFWILFLVFVYLSFVLKQTTTNGYSDKDRKFQERPQDIRKIRKQDV